MSNPRTSGALAVAGLVAVVSSGVFAALYFRQYTRDVRVSHAYMCGRVSVLVASVGSGVHETERCRQVRETWEAMK